MRSDVEILVFSAPWCAACKTLKNKLQMKGVVYEEIDVDDPENESLVVAYKVRSLPTTIGLKEGDVVLSVAGAGAIRDVLELMEGR